MYNIEPSKKRVQYTFSPMHKRTQTGRHMLFDLLSPTPLKEGMYVSLIWHLGTVSWMYLHD